MQNSEIGQIEVAVEEQEGVYRAALLAGLPLGSLQPQMQAGQECLPEKISLLL